MKSNKELKMRGEVERLVGITRKEIEGYVDKGLLKPTERTESNHRKGYALYDNEEIAKAYIIKQLRTVGFSRSEIKKLLEVGSAETMYDEIIVRLEERRKSISDALEYFEKQKELINDYNDVYKKICDESMTYRMIDYMSENSKYNKNSLMSAYENIVNNEPYYEFQKILLDISKDIFEIKELYESCSDSSVLDAKVDCFIIGLVDRVNNMGEDDEMQFTQDDIIYSIDDMIKSKNEGISDIRSFLENTFGKEFCKFLGAKITERGKDFS